MIHYVLDQLAELDLIVLAQSFDFFIGFLYRLLRKDIFAKYRFVYPLSYCINVNLLMFCLCFIVVYTEIVLFRVPINI